MKEKVGKTCYEFVNNNWDFTKTYTITAFNEEDLTYTIKDKDGNEKKVMYYYVLIAPNKSLDEMRMIDKYLSDNGIYGETYKSDNIIIVDIEWGDWKHDHIWCENLMGYIGYSVACEEEVTDENGSDCYSARHYFAKNSSAK